MSAAVVCHIFDVGGDGTVLISGLITVCVLQEGIFIRDLPAQPFDPRVCQDNLAATRLVSAEAAQGRRSSAKRSTMIGVR